MQDDIELLHANMLIPCVFCADEQILKIAVFNNK